MLAIWLLVRSYSIKGTITALTIKSTNTLFLINLLEILSSPFAIIIAAGNNKNKNSVLFLFGTRKVKNNATSKFTIKRIQLFLKELFTEKAFGDFKNIATTDSIRISTNIQ
ncbi:MAG: hypothetical protein ACI9WV_001815 [Patiriisocius sp.]|jgi:hypothetical protein